MRTKHASCLALLGLGIVTACTSPPPPNSNVVKIVAVPDEAVVGGAVELLVDLAPGVGAVGLKTIVGTPIGQAEVAGPGPLPAPLVGNVDAYELGEGFVRIALSGLPKTPAIEDDEPLGGCPPYVPVLPYFLSTQLGLAADKTTFSVVATPSITASITSPAEAEEVGQSITVDVATTGEVEIVDFYLNGEFVGADTDSFDGFSLDLDTRSLEDGSVLLTAMGRAGNQPQEVAIDSVHFTVGNDPPGGVIDSWGFGGFFAAGRGAPAGEAARDFAPTRAASVLGSEAAAPKGVAGTIFSAQYGSPHVRVENGVPYTDPPALPEEDVPEPEIPLRSKISKTAGTGEWVNRAGTYHFSSFTVAEGGAIALACDQPLEIRSQGNVVILDDIACSGGDLPSISIVAGGDIRIRGNLSVKGDGASGGTIELVSTSSHASIEVYGDLIAEGTATGGVIAVTAEGSARLVGGTVSASSDGGSGGLISIRATTANGAIQLAGAELVADGETGGAISLRSTGTITAYESVLSASGNSGDGGPIELLANGTISSPFSEYNATSRGAGAGDVRVATSATLAEPAAIDLFAASVIANSWEDHTEGGSIVVTSPGLISTIFSFLEASQTEGGPEFAGGQATGPLQLGTFGTIQVLTRDGPILNYVGFASTDGTESNLAGGTVEFLAQAGGDVVNSVAWFRTIGGALGATVTLHGDGVLHNEAIRCEARGANGRIEVASAGVMDNTGASYEAGDAAPSVDSGSSFLDVASGASMVNENASFATAQDGVLTVTAQTFMNNQGAIFQANGENGNVDVSAGSTMDNDFAFFQAAGQNGDVTVTAPGDMSNPFANFQAVEGNGRVTVTAGGMMDNEGAGFRAGDGSGTLDVTAGDTMNNDDADFQADGGGGETRVRSSGDMGVAGAFFGADGDGVVDVVAGGGGDMIGTGATFSSSGILDGGGTVSINAASVDLTGAAVSATGDGRCDETDEEDEGFENLSGGGTVSIIGAITLPPMTELRSVISVSGSPVGTSSPAVPDDTDGDGLTDEFEGDAPTGPDGDGCPNTQDWDSDGDGIPDADEGEADSDSDGCPNFIEDNFADADDDGDPAHLDPDEGC